MDSIELRTNLIGVHAVPQNIFQYKVRLYCSRGRPVRGTKISKEILAEFQNLYATDLNRKDLVYDGEKTMFTFGPLPQERFDLSVTLKGQYYDVVIRYSRQFATHTANGHKLVISQEALSVFNSILREKSKRGLFRFRGYDFHELPQMFCGLQDGLQGCRGVHTSFRSTRGGLTLNIDVATTVTVRPGMVIGFLLDNQNVADLDAVDWNQAAKTLKNLRIRHLGKEYKIRGISTNNCSVQEINLTSRIEGNGEATAMAIKTTVYKYYTDYLRIYPTSSANFPCIIAGKRDTPFYFPLELCALVSLQRYTKPLSSHLKLSQVEKSRLKPEERKEILKDAFQISGCKDIRMLNDAQMSVGSYFLSIEGHTLATPTLLLGNGKCVSPHNGHWSYTDNTLVKPTVVNHWAVVNFSSTCDVNILCKRLSDTGKRMGLSLPRPLQIFEETAEMEKCSLSVRVKDMLRKMLSCSNTPQFVLCLFPEKKTKIYGPWKRVTLFGYGIISQFMSTWRLTDHVLSNIILKINVKLGGLNSLLAWEGSGGIPMISDIPTVIFGMSISHSSPERNGMPSIAAVVSSRGWPHISQYKASVRSQPPGMELIECLSEEDSNVETVDKGIICAHLIDFYRSASNIKPGRIIIFRNGVTESQFDKILSVELDQIVKVCNKFDNNWHPKFTVIVAQKDRHIKFFQDDSKYGVPLNVPPGTVINNQICHPKNCDFFICPHSSSAGTTRPMHYYILRDDSCFSHSEVETLVYHLSYGSQRSNSASSFVAPLQYGRLAALLASRAFRSDPRNVPPFPVTVDGKVEVPPFPVLEKSFADTMFFI